MTTKGIVYYTDNRLDPIILNACQRQLDKIQLPIISVSLSPISFGENYVVPLKRSYLTMFKQILLGLQMANFDIVYLNEHDVLYHPTHYDFTPHRNDTYYYNRSNHKVRYPDGQALFYNCEQTLGLCGDRQLLLEHYTERVYRVEKEGFSRKSSFEPGKRKLPHGYDNNPWDWYMSKVPNIDIRHGQNLTESRWTQDEFRSQRNCTGWVMSDEVQGWGRTKGCFVELLRTI